MGLKLYTFYLRTQLKINLYFRGFLYIAPHCFITHLPQWNGAGIKELKDKSYPIPNNNWILKLPPDLQDLKYCVILEQK